MKRKAFILLLVLLLCVPQFAFLEITEIPLSCDACGKQQFCNVVVTGEGERDGAWGEYYKVVCPCGEVLQYTWRMTGPLRQSDPETDLSDKSDDKQPAGNDPPANQGSGNPPANQGSGDLLTEQGSGNPPANQGSGNSLTVQGSGDPPESQGSDNLLTEQSSGDSTVNPVQSDSKQQTQPQNQTQNEQSAEPGKTVTVSPAADNPSESSGSSESAVTVNQPDPEAQTQTQQQNQTQNELLTESEKPATVSPAADSLSESSGSSESAVTVNQPDPEAQTQTQQQNQTQNELLTESEKPVTLPSTTGEGTESADENAHTAVTVQEGQQQTSLEEIQVVVVGGDISIIPDTSGEEIYVGQQQEISEKQTSKTTGRKKTGDTGKQKKKKKETRDLQKYPLFSLVYPSRRLNMPGDPEAWAGIPGEKIYPVSGTSLLIEMINGGR